MFSLNNSRAFLCSLIILFIGFQQFPVIRVGGSFKVYELFAFFLFFLSLASGSIGKQKELFSLLFFVLSPLISLLFFYVAWSDDINGYYERFGNKYEFRYNVYVATLVPCFYYFLCWIAFSEISKSDVLYSNRYSIIKKIILIGHFIGWYSLSTAFLNSVVGLPSLVQMLPEWLQNVGGENYGFRAFGFSQEPSFYVLFQGWVFLLTYHYRHLWGKFLGGFFSAFSLMCLLMTFSSALAGFVAALFISSLFGTGFLKKIKSISFIILFILTIYILADYLGFGDAVSYAFYRKLQDFFSMPETTIGSGQFRAYTAALGIEIFKDYPFIGVGPGASIFFMHAYEYKIPIRIFGETLNAGSFPQNSYISVLSDLGVIGFLSMLALLYYIYKVIAKARKINSEITPFYTGMLFTLFSLLSVAPAYSMFIWVFPAFGVCIARHINTK
ncbi:O-antigen ligase family protein [Pectobacterium cacticida]|uniref:O-antigen ligase family protein n=1 Tax=Pectobacterium cacticida TaxID=69221 RepID=UPI002FF41AC7